MDVLDIVLTIIGIYQIVISFMMETKNGTSSFMFKVIPFFIGCFCMFYAFLNSGIISLNI